MTIKVRSKSFAYLKLEYSNTNLSIATPCGATSSFTSVVVQFLFHVEMVD